MYLLLHLFLFYLWLSRSLSKELIKRKLKEKKLKRVQYSWQSYSKVSRFKTVLAIIKTKLASETFIMRACLPKTNLFIEPKLIHLFYICVSINSAGHHNWPTC